MAALHTMLVPLDGSPPSIAALEHAIALAEDTGASIEILHVKAPDEFALGSTTSASPDARQEIEEAMNGAFDRAHALLGDRVKRRTASGDPLRAILETASDGEYDIIVMGTHGRVGRMHTLLGSVAEGVVRNAPCPVLTVREPGVEYESFAARRHGEPSLAEQVEHRHTHARSAR